MRSTARRWSIECTGIQCLVVGLNDAGVTLLEKARHWVESAITLGEIPNNHYSKYGSEAERLFRLARCRWLLYGKHDQESLDEGTRFSDLYYESFDDAEYRQSQAEESIVRYLEAGRYARWSSFTNWKICHSRQSLGASPRNGKWLTSFAGSGSGKPTPTQR